MEVRSSSGGGCGNASGRGNSSTWCLGANGGGQEKVPRLLLKLGARSSKEDGVRVVGCWPGSNASDGLGR
jgi:hypothetical protein